MVYYHPDSGALADELEQLIRRVVADCHQWDLPVFLEPMSYSLNAAVSKDSADFAGERRSARRRDRAPFVAHGHRCVEAGVPAGYQAQPGPRVLEKRLALTSARLHPCLGCC